MVSQDHKPRHGVEEPGGRGQQRQRERERARQGAERRAGAQLARRAPLRRVDGRVQDMQLICNKLRYSNF